MHRAASCNYKWKKFYHRKDAEPAKEIKKNQRRKYIHLSHKLIIINFAPFGYRHSSSTPRSLRLCGKYFLKLRRAILKGVIQEIKSPALFTGAVQR